MHKLTYIQSGSNEKEEAMDMVLSKGTPRASQKGTRKFARTRQAPQRLTPHEATDRFEVRVRKVGSEVSKLYGAYEQLRQSGVTPAAIGQLLGKSIHLLGLSSETLTTLVGELRKK